MRVAVAGASGFIGSRLCPTLVTEGHQVRRLVRRAPNSSDEIEWNPKTGFVDTAGLADVDAVINLAGAGVGDKRWTDAYKQEIRDSRVLGTAALAKALAELPAPKTFIAGSAIGYYGDRGAEVLTESSAKGTGFLSDVVAEWEQAADPARAAGVRVVHPRTGLVAGAHGGAWQRMLKIFRLGVGGTLGPGDQFWSYISLRDTVRAFTFLLTNETISGPVNITAPHPATNKEVTKSLGRILNRPTLAPAPAFALKAVLGEFSTEVLSSARVHPEVLSDAGFAWRDETIDDVNAFVVNDS